MSRQQVLVIGASGFIGRRITAALAATTWARPIAASRGSSPDRYDEGVTALRLDATDAVALKAALVDADAVISCLAGSPEAIRRSGRALLAAASAAARPPRIVYLSSMAAYGRAVGTVDENAPLRADMGGYGQAKAEIDALLATLPNSVRLRPGLVYGIGSAWWSDRIARLLVQRRLGNLGPAGRGCCNLVHVDDVAFAAVRAVELGNPDAVAVNLANPDAPTWNGYFERYAQALGAAPVRQIGSARLAVELRVIGPALKLAELSLRGANPWRDYEAIRPWLTQLCSQELRVDGRKATTLLGLEYRGLDAGLAQTARWFLAGGRT